MRLYNGNVDMSATPTLPDEPETDPETSAAPVFGVDKLGGVHRYDSARDCVIVTDRDGRVERVATDVGREQIVADGKDWHGYVAEKRGWIDCWWSANSFVETFGRLESALEQVSEP